MSPVFSKQGGKTCNILNSTSKWLGAFSALTNWETSFHCHGALSGEWNDVEIFQGGSLSHLEESVGTNKKFNRGLNRASPKAKLVIQTRPIIAPK
jgi:hypothetical protein